MVDLQTFVKVLLENQIKVRFEGLDGYHRNLGEALAADRDHINLLVEADLEHEQEMFDAGECEFPPDYYDTGWCWESNMELVGQEEYYKPLEGEYPVAAVYDPASTEEMLVEDVWFICPGGFGGLHCGQPIMYDSAYEADTRGYYCGCCGTSSGDFDEESHLGMVLDDLGSRQWPFFGGEEIEISGNYEDLMKAGRKVIWKDGKVWERRPVKQEETT